MNAPAETRTKCVVTELAQGLARGLAFAGPTWSTVMFADAPLMLDDRTGDTLCATVHAGD